MKGEGCATTQLQGGCPLSRYYSAALLGFACLAALPASAEEREYSLQADSFRCLAKTPVTDFLCQGAWKAASAADNGLTFGFTTINQFGELTADFDQVDDVRDFTSEALFSASAIRLDRELTDDELRAIARIKPQWESFNRLSIGAPGFPILDISYKRRELDDAQITEFFDPSGLNDVDVDEYGVGLRYGDLSTGPFAIQGVFRRAQRTGLIEFLPDADEDVDEFQLDAIVGSQDVNASATYVHQDIEQDIADPYERGRDIYAGRLSGAFGAADDFELFAGGALDVETFGDVDVTRADYYVGGVLYGRGSPGPVARTAFNVLDIGGQGTVYTSEADGDPTQDNSQFRTNAFLRMRSGDWRYALTVPISYDTALDGPDSFENVKVGVELSVQPFAGNIAAQQRVLLSLRYEHQEFFNIDDQEEHFLITLAAGF
jgi:hypothetical protein